MKKTNIIKIDRNTSSIDEYFTRSIHSYQNTNLKEQASVEKIELDNSNTSESDDDSLNFNRRHAWCYVDENRSKVDEQNYKINKIARERRRMNNKVCPELVNKDIEYFRYQNSEVNNSEGTHYTDYNLTWDNVIKERALISHPLNCFTIINNELADSDQSLSDKENDLEVIQCGDVVLESNYCNNEDNYNAEIKNYNKDLDNSKRTIWIYSYKNKKMLSENGKAEESSEATSSSSSTIENVNTKKFENKIGFKDRIASPIPTIYIPRLNFYAAATLPTVKEVAEPYQFAPDNLEINTTRSNARESLALSYNWLEENDSLYKYNDELTIKTKMHTNFKNRTTPSNNILHWMALSPRERRRNLKLPNVTIGNNLIEEILENDIYELKDIATETKKTKKSSDHKFYTDRPLTYVRTKRVDDTIKISVEKDKLEDNSIDEKGQYNKIKHLNKPQFRLKKILPNNTMTDSCENLNGDGWIGYKNYNDKTNFNIDLKNANEDIAKPKKIMRCAGDRLLNKHTSLLKPVEWSEYLPITESTPSLHLSLPSDINEEKPSWFKHILNCIQCCKKCKK